MSDTGLVIFMILFLAIAIPAFIFSLWCVRREKILQERFEGFFTRAQSFLFANVLLAAVCCILLGIATPFVMGGSPLLYLLAGPVLALYPVSVYRKLVARYGKVAALEIAKGMYMLETARAMRKAAKIFGVVAFETLPHTYIDTVHGTARVIRCGENSYVDAEGNLYTREDLV